MLAPSQKLFKFFFTRNFDSEVYVQGAKGKLYISSCCFSIASKIIYLHNCTCLFATHCEYYSRFEASFRAGAIKKVERRVTIGNGNNFPVQAAVRFTSS